MSDTFFGTFLQSLYVIALLALAPFKQKGQGEWQESAYRAYNNPVLLTAGNIQKKELQSGLL